MFLLRSSEIVFLRDVNFYFLLEVRLFGFALKIMPIFSNDLGKIGVRLMLFFIKCLGKKNSK